LPDILAEALTVGHIGLLAIGILLWAEVRRPLPALAAGTVVVALWTTSTTAAGWSDFVIHLPLDVFFGAALGLSAWVLWVHATGEERLLRRVMAVIVVVWAVQELSSATFGWHTEHHPAGFMAIHGYGTSLALLLIVAALRRRHREALAAIDEARRIQTLADQANKRLTDFARTSSDWFWEQDADLRFTYLSESVFDHSTLRPEDHYGKTRRETAPQGVSDAQWAEHDALLARREPFRDFRFVRSGPDGEARILSISGVPVFDGDGQFRGYRGVGRDLTQLVRAEQRVSAINARLLQAIDARSEGLAFWDRDDRLVICNQAYRDQSGSVAAALVPGLTFADYMRASVEAQEVPAAVGRAEEWLAERLERRRHLPDSFEVFRGDRWLLVREQRTPDGGSLTTATDISDMKRRENALIEAASEAHLANRAKMAFLATMSHELRTPLNAIIGFAEILRSGGLGANTKVQTEYAGYIHESGTHLLAVINDLLDVSRIEAGRLTLDETPFAVSGLLEECDRMIRQRAEADGLRLAIAAVDPGLGIRGDRRAMKQVLLNLLSNAVKFTERGGAVTLIAEGDDVRGLRIVVRDTGIGVDPDRIAELFEPFRQLENVHARRHHGTGLGLFICKSLVEAHGGTIAFDSAIGEGSAVTVELPPERVIETAEAARRRSAG
jgi:two-component system cell cycle sensor histidine kinase PleC